jgi:hypothetical protein
MLDYLKQFLYKFKSLPYFAFTFLTRLTHDSLADTRKADAIYLKIFEDISRDVTLNKTVSLSLVLDKTFCCEQVHQCGKMPASSQVLPVGISFKRFSSLNNLLEKSMENLQIYLYAKTSLYQRSNTPLD